VPRVDYEQNVKAGGGGGGQDYNQVAIDFADLVELLECIPRPEGLKDTLISVLCYLITG